jgi:transcriptional repressor of cell division inhibition gene dicB
MIVRALNIGYMKTADVIELFGTASSVADLLGLSRSAIAQWGDDVPKLRQYELRELRPGIDRELSELQSRRAAA